VRSPWHEAPRRRAGWFALIAGVVLAHLLLAAKVAADVIGWDASEEPRRIDVALVRELAPAPPPEAAPAPAAPPAPRPARAVAQARPASAAPQPAASSPEEAASASHEALRSEALALAAALAPSAPASVPAAPAPVAAAASGAPAPIAGPPQPALDWPPSTRLTYTLTGQWGTGVNLYGTGFVEWRRDGDHYQVQFDVSETPWVDEHMLSDGRITAEGLSPRSYDERLKIAMRDPKLMHIEFGEDEVVLANGNRVPKLPRSQDGASQFVQFVWMFATQPQLLREGNLVDIPLALPKNLRRWQYRVGKLESLALPFGSVDAVHIAPTGPFRPGELAVEIWVAPALQYLPVQVRVKPPDSTDHFADLSLDARPLQAAPAVPKELLP
jgi:hypothetical protein